MLYSPFFSLLQKAAVKDYCFAHVKNSAQLFLEIIKTIYKALF